jgi:hypothetical protein
MTIVYSGIPKQNNCLMLAVAKKVGLAGPRGFWLPFKDTLRMTGPMLWPEPEFPA